MINNNGFNTFNLHDLYFTILSFHQKLEDNSLQSGALDSVRPILEDNFVNIDFMTNFICCFCSFVNLF